jgi:LCP family protein required for cell wall assembly
MLRELRRRGRRTPEEPGTKPRKPITPRRVLKWLVLAAVGWIAFSVLLFLISAQLEQNTSGRLGEALTGGGNLFTGSTILVIGSDQRSKETAEPGSGGPSRSDTMLLLHVGFGSVRRLSILRDSYAQIPGHGAQKINAAYAIGGPALTIKTVEGFMGGGLHVNHMIEVSFEDFPKFIDALGGIDVNVEHRICSPPFGNFPKGIRLGKGKHHLGGRKALGFSRVRKNPCTPREDDRARVRRQQQVLSAIRSKALSPTTFFRLPWVSWTAPKTIRTDMAGPNLMLLFSDLMTGGAGKTRVLQPTSINNDGSLAIPESKRRKEARILLHG